jgi:uncharacterized protein (TIGR00255 family)
MIKSMTGYGMAGFEDDAFIIGVEVKTLNSKFLDLTIRSPRQFADKEAEIRNMVNATLERGKVNVSIDFSRKVGVDLPVSINESLFESYYQEYLSLAKKVNSDTTDLFKLALQSPNVISHVVEKTSVTEEWESVKKVLAIALENCNGFRMDEGNVLEQKFEDNLLVISTGLNKIKDLDQTRKSKVKERIRGNFRDWLDDNSFDENRFEQELIYYFEKLDITEELVRLETHLDYFGKIMNDETGQGKKLGFISQEIGREINTIGSKANDADMQKHVIVMKDELEKIKEQALNIL